MVDVEELVGTGGAGGVEAVLHRDGRSVHGVTEDGGAEVLVDHPFDLSGGTGGTGGGAAGGGGGSSAQDGGRSRARAGGVDVPD